MREIELGKRLGDSPQPNIVRFIGCVTTRSKQLHFLANWSWLLTTMGSRKRPSDKTVEGGRLRALLAASLT